MKDYEVVIGLEVHVELATKTKIFCGCSTEFGGAPNSHTCPVCTGMPGSLPVLNKKVVAFFYLLVYLLAALAQMVGTAFCIMVGEGSVTVFEHETTFLLACLVAPVNIHLIIIR